GGDIPVPRMQRCRWRSDRDGTMELWLATSAAPGWGHGCPQDAAVQVAGRDGWDNGTMAGDRVGAAPGWGHSCPQDAAVQVAERQGWDNGTMAGDERRPGVGTWLSPGCSGAGGRARRMG